MDTTSDEVKNWAPSFENYSFKDNADGSTTLSVEMDVDKKYRPMFEKMWPEALALLKDICEQ